MDMFAVCVGSCPAGGGGVIQQRLWLVTPEVAEQVADMLDGMGFERMSGLMDAGKATEFAEQNIIGVLWTGRFSLNSWVI